jgi:hypothetical protein
MRNDFEFVSLQSQAEKDTPELLGRKIEEFCCTKDSDVEIFLKKDALRYEREGYGRTYLYMGFENSRTLIAAYFTLAITVTNFREVTKSRKRRVLHSKPGRDSQDYFGGLLVGQIARCDGFTSVDISGQEMLADAEKIIELGRRYLGGKILYLDCKEKLIPVYENNGYELVRSESYASGYYKMFKILPPIF